MELGSQFEGFGVKLFSLFRVVHTYCCLPAETDGSRSEVLLCWSNISDVSHTCRLLRYRTVMRGNKWWPVFNMFCFPLFVTGKFAAFVDSVSCLIASH